MSLRKSIASRMDHFAMRLLAAVNRFAYRRFHEYPFGSEPLAGEERYRELWQKEREREYPAVDERERCLGFAIDRKWFEELALLTQVTIKKEPLCYQHGRLLYAELSAYISRADAACVNILEVGTARGFSALCMAKALSDARQPGKILTFDVLPHNTKMLWNCVADASGSRSRAELLGRYGKLLEEYIVFEQGDTSIELCKVAIPRIHFAFLDGTHTYDRARAEFEFVSGSQEAGDIVFFDDYTQSCFPGIVRAVDDGCTEKRYSKEVVLATDARGYAVAKKK